VLFSEKNEKQGCQIFLGELQRQQSHEQPSVFCAENSILFSVKNALAYCSA
jgi:hypothetical protein